MARTGVAGAILAVALAVLAAAPRPARADDGPSLLRTTLIVADVERSMAFYRLLGFGKVEEMGGGRDAESPFPLNVRSRKFRLVVLADARRSAARIGVLQFEDARPEPVRAPRRRVGLGDMVFVVDVPDAVAVHAALVEAGADVVEPPQVFRSRSVDARGRPIEGRVFHVFDPDGYLVELLEAAKPARGP